MLAISKFAKISLVSAGLVGGGTGAYFLISNNGKIKISNTISSRLGEVGYLPLNENSGDGEWEKILTGYNKIREKNDIFEGSTITQENREGLKQKCKEALLTNTDKNYELAKRWCVKEETIKDMLARNKHSKLDTTNKEKWREKVNLLKGNSEALKNIGIAFQNNDGDLTLLESKCGTFNIDTAKTHESKDFEKNYINAKDWCSIKNIN